MLRTGILNPHLAALLCRFRHTNTLVIADRGFPFWREVETIDLSLTDDIPTVREVLAALSTVCVLGGGWMAEEFLESNPATKADEVRELLGEVPLHFEPHARFKRRVPLAIGLIRTGDTTPYANLILESA